MSALDTTAHESTNLQGFYSYHDYLKGIYYGPGVVETALPKLLYTLGGNKALIVTGKSLFEKVERFIYLHMNALIRQSSADGCREAGRGDTSGKERIWRDAS